MPEETILRCDAPGCDEIGEYVDINVAGVTSRVILGKRHRKAVDEIAGWGKVIGRVKRPDGRRDTSRKRLEALIDADKQ